MALNQSQFQLPTFERPLKFFTPEMQELHKARNAQLSAKLVELNGQLAEAQQAGDAQAVAALNEQIWLTNRLYGISGSVIGTVAGLNKWQTPYSAWCEYTGRTEHNARQSPAMEWGHRLEETVAQAYADKMGLIERGYHLVNQETVCSPEFPFLIASVDRLVIGPDACLDRILEVKTASFNYDTQERDEDGSAVKAWGRGNLYDAAGNLLEQDSQVPTTYLLQVMLYMLVMKCPKADIAVLINTNDFRIFTIDYDPAIARHLVLTADDFWCDHVLRDVAVEMVESDAKQLTPVNGASIEATPEMVDHISALRDIEVQLKALEDAKKLHRDAVAAFIGTNERMTLNGKSIATYTMQKGRTSFNQKAFAADNPDLYAQYTTQGSSFRVLRLSKLA